MNAPPGAQTESKANRLPFRLPNIVNAVLIAYVLVYVVFRASTMHGFHLHAGSVSSEARDLLWFAFACGLLSFATIECVKRLTFVRAWYHARETEDWLRSRFERLRAETSERSDFSDETRSTYSWTPFSQLEAAMGEPDDRRRVFNLPSEQLAAQISAATDLALTAEKADRERYAYFLAAVTRDGRDLPGSMQTETEEERDFRRAQQVRIGLDQLQVALRDPWRRYLWGAGLWLSGAYGIGLAFAGGREAVEGPRHVLAALVLGGVVAAIARDLTAIVERLRG